MQITIAKPTVSVEPKSRVALFSHRELNKHVAHCFIYEFEDLVADVENVSIFAPTNSLNVPRKINTLANILTKSTRFADLITPQYNPIVFQEEYELFFAVFSHPFEVFDLNSLSPNWYQNCQKAVCYLIEVWDIFIQGREFLLEPLKKFDHIFLGVRNGVEKVAQVTGRPCSYLPPSIDTLKFCPYPALSHRGIDVLSIGRRSPITHQTLLDISQRKNLFYYYDTIRNLQAISTREHRILMSNLAKRSRYFIANRPNVDENYKTKGKEELGYRFFEGAAAGTVMLGEHPTHEEFHKHFDWQDAVIKVTFDAPDIGDLIAELDEQPERLARIRKDNVVNSLLRHDFVYRWQEILAKVGLKPTPKMLSRETELSKLADGIYHEN